MCCIGAADGSLQSFPECLETAVGPQGPFGPMGCVKEDDELSSIIKRGINPEAPSHMWSLRCVSGWPHAPPPASGLRHPPPPAAGEEQEMTEAPRCRVFD